jgi:hypothetical protein
MKDLPDICMEIENSLPLWVGGDLEADAQRAVDEHLARCARCAERAGKAREARASLVRGLNLGMDHAGAGRDPWPAIRSGLAAEGFLAKGYPNRGVRARPVQRIAVRWSAAAAVLVAVFFAWTRFTNEPETPIVPPASISGTPVRIQTAGLRPLAPTERRLRDSAQAFGMPDDVLMEPWRASQPVGSQQAGLEQAVGSPPK